MNQYYEIIHLDDNPVFLEETGRLIRRIDDCQINYKGIVNKDKANALIKKNNYDLFISDLMIEDDNSEISGKTFITEISKKFPTLKILVLSARSKYEFYDYFQSMNIQYMEKTFNPYYFGDDIKNLIMEK